MAAALAAFVGGIAGRWRVERVEAVSGPSLDVVDRLDVVDGPAAAGRFEAASWVLRAAVSYERYATRSEHDQLAARQAGLGRPEATRAALIPISKAPRWWALSADERREIFADRSHHIAIGQEYLPAIARRLYHGHDLGEPFDFLTWFEYAPADAEAFERLVDRLRQIEHWTYVDREVDIRLVRASS